MDSYSFFITSFIIILLPGTGVIYTISNGITLGKKSAIIAAIGCTAGIIPHLIVSICLSSMLMKMNETAFFILKILGGFYLFYLGLGMILSKSKLDFNKTVEKEKYKNIITKAVLINVLNPKLTLFFFSFLPQYINGNTENYIWSCFLLGLLFMLITLIVFVIYGVLAGFMKSFFVNSPKKTQWIQRIFGIIFIVFAVNLLTASM